jgi:hypothetical protein
VNAKSRKNLYARIGISFIGLGFLSVGLAIGLRAEEPIVHPRLGGGLVFAPVFVLISLLVMGMAIFKKDDPPETTGRRNRRSSRRP